MGLVAPLIELVQLGRERDKVSCKTNPGVFGVQEIVANPGAAGTMMSVGAPRVWTAVGRAQKPPGIENWPLVMTGPASGWPMVPLREKLPLVLVPPPPSMVNQSMEN